MMVTMAFASGTAFPYQTGAQAAPATNSPGQVNPIADDGQPDHALSEG
jgi:hypothetical protein